MAEKSYSLDFDGYWRDENKGGIPSQSGVYCVYECRHDTQRKTVTLLTLIYIGEADNVNDRIANHEKYDDWLAHVGAGNELCYTFAPIGAPDRQRCEAALIFKHKPPENTEYKDAFPFDTTHMTLSGKTALLNPKFTVRRT